ncbi:MAG: iron-containing alcohol dehydrogenase, partial [Synergistaceae bacterium]|nr:iron-containing alcohol dehydrogenase [Synergistaceae bacterium]
MLSKYTLGMPKQVFSGEDSLSNIGPVLKSEGVKKLAIFTDKGIEGAGLLDFPLNEVKKSGVDYVILNDLPPEPSYTQAQKLVDQCREYGADFILAVGGGSVMDTAKLSSV